MNQLRLYEIKLRNDALELEESGFVAAACVADAEAFLLNKFVGARITNVREMGRYWVAPRYHSPSAPAETADQTVAPMEVSDVHSEPKPDVANEPRRRRRGWKGGTS